VPFQFVSRIPDFLPSGASARAHLTGMYAATMQAHHVILTLVGWLQEQIAATHQLARHALVTRISHVQSVFSDYKLWSHEADIDGHEGYFYTCNATHELNEEVGDLELRVVELEVR
jgi:hypothetical protein